MDIRKVFLIVAVGQQVLCAKIFAENRVSSLRRINDIQIDNSDSSNSIEGKDVDFWGTSDSSQQDEADSEYDHESVEEDEDLDGSVDRHVHDLGEDLSYPYDEEAFKKSEEELLRENYQY